MPMETIDSIKTLQHKDRAIGFYGMHFLESIGYCAGFLVLSRSGRPVEFHCTMPVQPNRSQEILFGNSLVPHLLCEHIGPPLIKRAKTAVQAIIVQQADALGLAKNISSPVVVVQSLNEYEDGDVRFQVMSGEVSEATELDASCLPNLDWGEPFQRISTAIEEAHAVAR